MCDATFGRAGELGGNGMHLHRGPCSQHSQSIQSYPTQSNPIHPTLIFNNQTPTLVPFFVRRCVSSSLASDHFFSSLLPARSPGRSPYLHNIVAPGLHAGGHMWPATLSAPPPPSFSLPSHICRLPRRATSSAMSSPSPISPTLTFTMLTYLFKHLYLPCLSLLSGHVGRLWSDQLLLPGSVEGLH